MPYPVKIQPIDFNAPPFETVVKPVLKSRFKRLIERQFSSVLRTSAAVKPAGATEPPQNFNKDGGQEFEPSSVCLAKMVQNFIEESSDKQGKNRRNCFNGNCTDSSDDEADSYRSSAIDACDALKSLVTCMCVLERNLLADTAKIVEKNKINKRKDGVCRKIVADGLRVLGYNASICKSKWEQSPSFPAGEYEYVDVIIENERLIIDIDFRSEFEIARSTKAYKMILQTLPNIFVGKANRLEKIIHIVSEAAKQSLKKKGMPFPPWRKADYVKAKWLSPFTRTDPNPISSSNNYQEKGSSDGDQFELVLGEKCKIGIVDGIFVLSNSSTNSCEDDGVVEGVTPLMKKWELPEIKPKSLNRGVKIVTGLAYVIED
ncbi:hypothetical protein BUALT_Bualt02G0212700 [Buddleja alternifolia]|uniref:DNA-directed RNA polymerase n=1 Tax=Buddleja alternifolia TaxID=168488 RepID=A0AAV6YAR9_9LAMI|nr:hypothetical protein BUALT_Bualt02G0212700 [Buddleja alternifolia]